ncbi:MAG: hypothetical protein Q4Q24_08060 [Methanobrevibacter ruminantium]|uniref:hypothetical protein n=1 Tax=Methanobrevibacter ruminantium TaxID=83816 RepID=UPI0026EC8DCB|nr:hypothetical protein [Methanobrevibacter ruminantium]MDO5843204.1 hypothetical protein [Methanobrevibacter ruminantium]
MEKSAFSTLEKTFLILLSLFPFINGMTFVYMGSKESNFKWIIEALVYEFPWFLQFLFAYNDDLATTFAGFGILFMFICLLRTVYVSFTYKKEIDSSFRPMRKISSSFWVVFSLIMFLNGVGLIIVGYRRNVQRWVLEGALFEFLWILYFVTYSINDGIINFFIAIAVIGWILSIARTIMIYFEEKRMDNLSFSPSPQPVVSTPAPDISPKPVENAVVDIILEFKPYKAQIDNQKQAFDKKEENITDLINKRFETGELAHNRFMSVIDNCHKLFYHQFNSATSIIEMAPECSERLDETVKDKISIMESINDEMNNLIEELIIHDSDNEKSEEDLKELFANMDNMINSVKDYK